MPQSVSAWPESRMSDENDLQSLALPSHLALLDRAISAIETGTRHVAVSGASGVGKSTLLESLAQHARAPECFVVYVHADPDEDALIGQIARLFRAPWSRADAWDKVDAAVQTRALQRQRMIVAIDNAHMLADPTFITRLIRLSPKLRMLSVVSTWLSNARHTERAAALGTRDTAHLQLLPLTRAEGDWLISERARRQYPAIAFAPDASTRIHALARGIPARIVQLADEARLIAISEGNDTVRVTSVDVLQSQLHAA